jgi:glucokinase
MKANRVIGVDVGGTKILAGIVDRDGTIEHHRETPTPLTSQQALLDGLVHAVEELRDDDIAGVGFGIPSRIDHQRGRVVGGSVNIPLGDLDFVDRMQERFGLPVGLENDANAATLAEYHAGVGRGTSTMVMLTLGTGVGGGVVLDGKLYRGWMEVGHTVVVADGIPCQGACTGRGHLEAYVSGHAATALAREQFGEAVDAHRLVRLANEGDRHASEILGGIGHYLGIGIASLVNLFDPQLVAIGGGFSAAGDYLLAPARESLRRDALAPAGDEVQVVRAALGTFAGMIGAGLVAFETLASA